MQRKLLDGRNPIPPPTLNQLAGIFLQVFPRQYRMGPAWCRRYLQQVLDETGLDTTALCCRIKEWARWRKDMHPLDMRKPAPRRASTEAPDQGQAEVTATSEEMQAWLDRVNSPWEGEDV